MIITAVYQCSEEPKDSPLKFNIYSSKKTSNTTEIRGNFTFGIPFDDSLIGEYRIVAAAIYQCADEPKNLPLKANLYLSKKSSNTTEVRGNCSLKIPFDDSLTGEYKMIITAVYQCSKEKKNLPLKFNIYSSKKSSNTTEIRGNFTFEIPFDDSLIFDVNVASWSLTGGWKPNSLVYVTKNACSKLKSILGNSWYSLIKAVNSPTTNCPIPKGIYISSGYDTTLFNDNNFPKVYFYGKYKYVEKIKNQNNKVVGCIAAELSIVRPWELTL
ncbi:uncharacterized protein LOC114130653 isoform X1 [Aphis gossypii]|uniref:uncharacterized protein LOC114130653 isoform X1 n=1 Tax=Aphis gossypii TaxID=80765 RepID=UPI00215902AB|nr:uncharacterized protein LOC114130653 isoform X1 [Aphis gossypii]